MFSSTHATIVSTHVTIAAVSHASPISTFQAIVLGLLQGVTELFPVSSLGHTVLFPTLFGWNSLVKAQSNPESFWLAFVVMLHVGSAVGLLLYFWRDWIAIVRAFCGSVLRRRIETPVERLAWLIVTASIPTGLLGLALEHPIRVALAKPSSAAIFLTINGVVLLAAERLRRRSDVRVLALREGVKQDGALKQDGARELDTLEYREAVLVGFAQSTALLPGISRDGMCMTAGLLRGLDNEDSARYAFLLATPIILAAGAFKFSDLTGPLGAGVRGPAIIAAACAAVAGYASVAFLVRYFKTRNLAPFGIYCLLFGSAMVVYTSVS
ncbi:MAG TPA: undecaprenyl-diphosphate phosphatase [Solirubrobacteraceae bacterium]|nr:undecaprenyl-diphosphate phosphatase [Solirubrobacteraceae bacterium]